jgi:hypothetical protein
MHETTYLPSVGREGERERERELNEIVVTVPYTFRFVWAGSFEDCYALKAMTVEF